MQRTSQFILSLSLMSMLSGCAAISQAISPEVYKPATAYNVAEYNGQSDAHHNNGDAGLNTAILARRLGFKTQKRRVLEEARTQFHAPMKFRIAPSEAAAPRLRGLMPRGSYEMPMRHASLRTERGVDVYRPFANPVAQLNYPPAPVINTAPRAPLQIQNKEPAAASNGQEVSYVKMGGGSDMADWHACEKMAGGMFVTRPTGFEVDFEFDTCMRARGYKTEQEAQAELKAAS